MLPSLLDYITELTDTVQATRLTVKVALIFVPALLLLYNKEIVMLFYARKEAWEDCKDMGLVVD